VVEPKKPIDFFSIYQSIQISMAKDRTQSRENAEQYIDPSGIVNNDFLSKFGPIEEGTGRVCDYTPKISLPLLTNRFFSEGTYKTKDSKHDSYCHTIPEKLRHDHIHADRGHHHYKYVSGYSGLDLRIGLVSKDKETVGDMAAYVIPSSTSVDDCSAYIKGLRIKKEDPKVDFLFVSSPITSLAAYDSLSRFFYVNFRDGFFIVEKDGKKNSFRVETTYCERGKGVIQDRSSMKKIAKFDLEKGTKTPRTDTTTQFIEAVFKGSQILQEVFCTG